MRPVTLSSGVVLRPYRVDDALALGAAVDRDRSRLGRWMPWVPHSTTPESFVAFITAARRLEDDGTAFHRGLFDGAVVAGGCGTTVDLVNREAEIGYWLGAVYEGRGLVTEAVGAMLGFLFDDYAVHRVVIRAAVTNVRSRAVAERYGFIEEGVQREALILDEVPTDAAMYSLLEDEWRRRRRSQ